MSKIIIQFIIMVLTVLILSQCIMDGGSIAVRPSTPPVIVFSGEPELTVIPQTDVYYSDNDGNDLFFYDGFWWRPWHNVWYRADDYSGSWIMIEEESVPYQVIHLPPRWKDERWGSARVRWGDARDHWREWQQERHWEKQGWKNDNGRDKIVNPPAVRKRIDPKVIEKKQPDLRKKKKLPDDER